MIITSLKCEALSHRRKCKNQGKYLIIWKGESRPILFPSFNQVDVACEECYNTIMKNHKKLVVHVIDLNDEERVILT